MFYLKHNLLLYVLVISTLCSCVGGYYVYPPANNGWEKYGDKPVLGDSITGTLFDPFVYIQGDSLVMIVSERKSGNIIRLTSIDGITWSNPITVLSHIENTWQHIVNRACVVKVDSIWHLYYTGQSPDTSRIGHAVSLNGLNYESDDKPVVVSTTISEGVSVMNPCVIYDNSEGIFKMWYAAGENYEPDAVFYAESTNGLEWKKNSTPVLTKFKKHKWEKYKVGGCYVLKDTISQYLYTMYYIGYQTIDIARICMATSDDGINWNRSNNNLLISPSNNRWDSHATYKPSVIRTNERELMWYNGRTNNKEYIGLAIKELETSGKKQNN